MGKRNFAELKEYCRLIRPQHWVKNLLIFVPLFFGRKIGVPSILFKAIGAFMSFSLAASAIYVINDIADAETDRKHPIKRYRPIASMKISIKNAIIITVFLAIFSVVLSAVVSPKLTMIILTYMGINLLYSFKLKQIAPLDIFIVSAGFVLRTYAGGVAADIPISNWLFLTVFLLSLFVSVAKRRAEIAILGASAPKHRNSLNHYSLNLLDGLMWITASASIVTYALYAVNKGGIMVWTVVPATYGLVRYLQIVMTKNMDEPIIITFTDLQMLLAISAFLILTFIGIYG
ncbi:MAG: decaprenyl-phosphate phosphoribosyltransferase [Bacteroidetes bacterium]|nr:MAG: decaprenyl-phosphate phosphoribosyltransferase [Bacteroidota bacterium]